MHLRFAQAFSRGILEPSPPTVQLLTMIRLLENVLGEVQKRDCPPLEGFVMGVRLNFWPVFQKDMNSHIESVKKLADASGGGSFLGGKSSVRDVTVQAVSYAVGKGIPSKKLCVGYPKIRGLFHFICGIDGE
ncbi:MAG TPA: hypothetical protein VGO47_05990 [Chlamydiales bacterium]|nr:hypothetical protein [Chlamydiales bacterium]